MNGTCPEDGKIEELPIGTFIKVLGVLSYFLGNLGNLLLLGIAYYEKFGQDPQKRSLPDRVLSFNIILAVFISVIHSNIIIVRIFFGPVGNAVTHFRYYLHSLVFTMMLGSTETILFRCLMIFSWKKYAMLNDEFFATFLNIFNFMMGQILSLGRFFIGDFFFQEGFKMFSGYCTNPKIPET